MSVQRRWQSFSASRPDYALILIVLALLAIGLIMVYSASFALAYEAYGDSTYFLVRQAGWTALGLLVMLVAMRIDYRTWQRASVPILALTLFLLLAVLLVGEEVNGARRWFLGGSIQPSELAKPALVIYIAHWLSSKGEKIREVSYGLIPFSVLIGLVTGLIILEPDFGTALLLVATAVGMFFLAGADLKQLGIGSLVGGATLLMLITQTGYAAGRLKTYLSDPLRDPFSAGSYHIAQTLIALGSGGLSGVGLGSSRQKVGFLPAPHTDAIFAILAEELGIVGSALVLGLFVLLAYRGLRIALRAPDAYSTLLAAGITWWLTLQALVNIGVLTATLPFTGLPLPLVSFGGSATITALAGLGILLNLSRCPPRETPKEDEAFTFWRWHRRPRLSRRGHGARAQRSEALLGALLRRQTQRG